MRASRMILQGSAALLALAFSLSASAAQIPVSSYSYPTSPHGSYPDSGGELTDGTNVTPAWGSGINMAGKTGPLVGWLNNNPAVTFNFAVAEQIKEIIVYAADSDNSAGVGLPSSFIVSTSGGFSKTYSVTNPAGSGTTVPIILSGFDVTSDNFTVSAIRDSQWTMFSEVEFYSTSSVPTPAGLGLVGLVALGILRRRSAV